MRLQVAAMTATVAFACVQFTPLALAQSAGDRPLVAMKSGDWTVQVVSSELSYPWSLSRAGDKLLVTEAAGNIVVIEGGRLQRFSVQTSDAIVQDGGSGLLGMALSEDFLTSGIAYLYHSYRSRQGLENKIIQARFDGSAWRETHVLLKEIPGHKLYNGGRIAFGPDGMLYATTGWTESSRLAQDLGSLAGKVLRMTRDGRVPESNPFPNSYVFTYGHRNPQGIAWNGAGELFISEHGQSAHDEINRLRAGGNYGWPTVTGGAKRDGMEPPVVHSGSETWAPSGIAFAGKELLVTALAARALYVLDERANALKQIFSSGDRLRDVMPVGRDLYVITTNRSPRAQGPSKDSLLRVSPKQ